MSSWEVTVLFSVQVPEHLTVFSQFSFVDPDQQRKETINILGGFCKKNLGDPDVRLMARLKLN
jgi:hypothetical protein